ncbi:KRAB-A domain-containing protein 2-like isoform X3 [Macrobrachium nipponense]|uniref:KRAB-A domain-containing protein 2-like isoform X3 n=1 Tax=Macrobrachium nipponense TaxID=159736 RepID=UPI0030C7F342
MDMDSSYIKEEVVESTSVTLYLKEEPDCEESVGIKEEPIEFEETFSQNEDPIEPKQGSSWTVEKEKKDFTGPFKDPAVMQDCASYRNSDLYEVLQCGPTEKLIKRRSTRQESPLYYVSIEETFDVVKSAHISTGHGGRDRMLKELQKKYANIPTKAVELFKSLCQECQKKRKRPMTKGVVVRPILTKEFSSRGQVDLIDMQSMPSGSNKKWIMVYQDHLTKFCILRALKSKRAAEVAFHLLDIFLLFGAPVILQSDNGSEFTSQVITELKEVWPKLTLVHGKPCHPQSQGSVERANGDIKDMLVAWLADNDSQDWPTGIKFVQFQKNSALHSGIKCSPYSAMFGCEARVGLTTSSLPMEVIARMETEEDLLAVTPIRPDSDNDEKTQTNTG